MTDRSGAGPCGEERQAVETVDTRGAVMTEERHGAIGGPLKGKAWHSGGWFRHGRVDPCCGWFGGRNRRFCHEPSGIVAERLIEDELAGRMNGVGLAVVHLVRCHQANP